MITGLDQMNPGLRPELELGFAGMRAKEIETFLVHHAKAGRITFEPGPYTKNQLVALANGYLAQGLIPSVKPVPVDPRKKEMDDLKAQVDALTKALQAKESAPAAPPPPPVEEVATAENVAPFERRKPGRPKKD